MKKTITTLIIMLIVFNINAQSRKEFFKSPKGMFLISSDLHIHSVFSDGEVWPSIRVKEARRDGLDLISLTEHLEYLSYKNDMNIKDRNRSFQISNAMLTKNEPLMVINGTEITKPMPPGHFNAVFVKDSNTLINPDGEQAIIEANKQGAFVFWNHPNWVENRDDAIARFDDLHEKLLRKKLFHGIEVVNEHTYSEEALALALENNLTIMGTSDIHGLIDWTFDKEKKYHRPVTFIISENITKKSIRDALFAQKTFVWHRDMLIGKEENILPIINENLNITSNGYYKKIVTIKISNSGVVPLKLKYNGNYTFHSYGSILEVPAKGELLVIVKTKEILEEIEMPFEILNIIVAPKQNLKINKIVKL
jgi:hypothetical protein